MISRSVSQNHTAGIGVRIIGGISYRITGRLALALESSAGGNIQYQYNQNKLMRNYTTGKDDYMEETYTTFGVNFGLATSIFRTLWLTYSF